VTIVQPRFQFCTVMVLMERQGPIIRLIKVLRLDAHITVRRHYAQRPAGARVSDASGTCVQYLGRFFPTADTVVRIIRDAHLAHQACWLSRQVAEVAVDRTRLTRGQRQAPSMVTCTPR
jgi:hypothetical protein